MGAMIIYCIALLPATHHSQACVSVSCLPSVREHFATPGNRGKQIVPLLPHSSPDFVLVSHPIHSAPRKTPDFKQNPGLLYRREETPPGQTGPEREGVCIVMASVLNSRDGAASGHPEHQTLAEQLDAAFRNLDPVARLVLLRDRVEGPLCSPPASDWKIRR